VAHIMTATHRDL